MQEGLPQRLNRSRKKFFSGWPIPSGAKALTDFAGLTARLEAAPVQNEDEMGRF
jgi:hypothetical protein